MLLTESREITSTKLMWFSLMYILRNCNRIHSCSLIHITPLFLVLLPTYFSFQLIFWNMVSPSSRGPSWTADFLGLASLSAGMLPHRTSLPTSCPEPCHCCMKVHFKGWSYSPSFWRGGKGKDRGKRKRGRGWRKEREGGKEREKREREKTVLNSHIRCQESNI